MPRVALFGKWCRRCACGAGHCLNWLLAGLAMLLTGLVLLNTLRTEIPIPAGLSAWILEKVAAKPYRLESEGVLFDLRGGLFLKNARLSDVASREILLSAEALYLDFAPLNALFRIGSPADALKAANARLFTPSRLSPSGLNEPLLEADFLNLTIDAGYLFLHDLFLDSGRFRLHLNGSAPLRLLRAQAGAGDSRQQRLDFQSLLAELHRHTHELDADCHVDWQLDPQGVHRFHITLLAGSIRHDEVALDELRASVDATLSNGRVELPRLKARGTVSAVPQNALDQLPAPFQPVLPVRFSMAGNGPVRMQFDFPLPSHLSLTLYRPLGDPIPVNSVTVRLDNSADQPLFHWGLYGPLLRANGTATPNPLETPARLPAVLEFRAQFDRPALRAFFPDLPAHRLLVNPAADYLRIHARTSPTRAAVSGLLVCDGLSVGDTDFAHLRAGFDLSSEAFHLRQADVVKSPREFASGSYSHHFPSSRFSLNARGTLFPHALDRLLGRWWMRIFTHIETDAPPAADVSVWGQWRAADALNSFTWVRGDGARYRGQRVPRLQVRVRSNRDWAYLEQLDGRFAEGAIRGTIGWRQGLDGPDWRPVMLDLYSDAPWVSAAAATGLERLAQLQLSGRPEVTVRGVLWQAPAVETAGAGEPADDLIPDLQIRMAHPRGALELHGFELNKLRLQGRVTGERIAISGLSGEFAGGILTGRVELLNWLTGATASQQLDLQLFDAEYDRTVRALLALWNAGESGGGALPSADVGGRIDANVQLRLRPELSGSSGSGLVTLRDARIGRIHIFGELSRVLDSIGLGFSTLDLNDASAQWRLDGARLELVECLVTGPVLNLRIAGPIDLPERRLDLRAEVNLFRGLISKVLTPVSDNFQFDLTGPLDNPVWRLRLNPLRWFQNRLDGGFGITGGSPPER
jgi:hypothetical protein